MLYIYPFKGGEKGEDKFKTFDDNKDELGFAAKPIKNEEKKAVKEMEKIIKEQTRK